MRPRTRLIRLQRTLYDRLKIYARDLLGGFNPELNRYFLEYKRDFSSFEEVSTKRELLSALQNAHIVVCGDYHTLSQAQRTVIRLLRDSMPGFRRRGRKLVLALEMARHGDNPKIADYLAGRLSEPDFLAAISFQRNWGFPWKNYRRLFHFARDQGASVMGINGPAKKGHGPTLRERDRFAAKVVVEVSRRDAKKLILILVGDLHLASSHLPRELKRELKRAGIERRVLVIHQNHESFYWDLAERGLEHLVDVVKVRQNEYCVLNTPPWVKLKSHVKWAEILMDEEAGRLKGKRNGFTHGGLDAKSLESLDFTDDIRELLTLVQDFLGITGPVDDAFQIASPSDLSFLNRLRGGRRWSKTDLRRLAHALSELKSLFVPEENILYLSDLGLNHAATQTSAYLHARVSGRKRGFRDPRADFYGQLWVEALGFLGSKVVNPRRKCNGPGDLLRIAAEREPGRESRRPRGDALVAALALQHLEVEKAFFSSGRGRFRGLALPGQHTSDAQVLRYRKVALLLGQLLGHALYTAAMENQISREELRALFEEPFVDKARARDLYLRWARRLDEKRYRQVQKTERL